MEKKNIYSVNLVQLKKILAELGFPAFRAAQVYSWIYQKKVDSFEAMRNLPQELKNALTERFSLFDMSLEKTLSSEDGTAKFLFALRDGNLIETVLIPAQGRLSACVSSQVGCKYACRFCASGILGFKRNLEPGEIIQQLILAQKNYTAAKITHVVFMGTGEPLDNYDNVLFALRLVNDKDAFGIGARRITISTSGLVPGIKKLSGEKIQFELSVSLHAADDKKRSSIMPVNNKYPLKELLAACRDYIRQTKRQITFEYILIKGFNSSLKDAQNLCKIAKELGLAKINIIPANPVKECGVVPPDKQEAVSFRDYLQKNKVNVTLRAPRGQDIDAACGQLRLRHSSSG